MRRLAIVLFVMFGSMSLVQASGNKVPLKKAKTVTIDPSIAVEQPAWKALKKNRWIASHYQDRVSGLNEANFQQFVHAHDEQGQTIFHHVIFQQKHQAAALLLACGVSVNVQNNKNGETALYQAACGGDCRSVEFLLDYGADKNIKAFDGGTASGVAMEYSGVYSLLNPVKLECSIS